jgi:hypothetical protein
MIYIKFISQMHSNIFRENNYFLFALCINVVFLKFLLNGKVWTSIELLTGSNFGNVK